MAHADKNDDKPKWRSSKNPELRMLRSIIFEFIQVGHAMRVVALDEETGVEVSIIAPLTCSQMEMEQVAVAKLQRRLNNHE